MSDHAAPGSHRGLAVAAGILLIALGPALLAPTAVADLTVGVCVWQVGEARLPLHGFPPGNTFIGVYAGPGTRGVYTSQGAFQAACNAALPGLL